MMESGYFNNGHFRECSYSARVNFAVLKLEFPVALAVVSQPPPLKGHDLFERVRTYLHPTKLQRQDCTDVCYKSKQSHITRNRC